MEGSEEEGRKHATAWTEGGDVLPVYGVAQLLGEYRSLCERKPDAEQWTVLVQRDVADWTRLTGLEVPHDTRPADCIDHTTQHNPS